MSRGEVNWNGALADGLMCQVCLTRPDPDQQIVTVTTFGLFNNPSGFRAFGKHVYQVRESMRRSDSVLAEFQINSLSGKDPTTVTLWRNEGEALDWSYRQETHRSAIDWMRTVDVLSRISFGRLLPVTNGGRAWKDTPL